MTAYCPFVAMCLFQKLGSMVLLYDCYLQCMLIIFFLEILQQCCFLFVIFKLCRRGGEGRGGNMESWSLVHVIISVVIEFNSYSFFDYMIF